MTVYLNGKYITVNEFRAHLVSDGWVLTGSKKLESIEASIFLCCVVERRRNFVITLLGLIAAVPSWKRGLEI